ncbi:hypothetical protein RJT34_33017 [Clitoria ternatea]|uniref:Transmembrane protein n=1 Tax=Clitoria ternatea TaxID=43366 RepID=A0AAN9EX20_CLITE
MENTWRQREGVEGLGKAPFICPSPPLTSSIVKAMDDGNKCVKLGFGLLSRFSRPRGFLVLALFISVLLRLLFLLHSLPSFYTCGETVNLGNHSSHTWIKRRKKLKVWSIISSVLVDKVENSSPKQEPS